jgi:2-methylcitrate dehydratase PrpD
MMDRLIFVEDSELTARFPAHRICRAVITIKSGEIYTSPDCEPRGEACENIGLEWLCEKFRRITAPVFTAQGQDSVLRMLSGDADLPVREIVREINRPEYRIEL